MRPFIHSLMLLCCLIGCAGGQTKRSSKVPLVMWLDGFCLNPSVIPATTDPITRYELRGVVTGMQVSWFHGPEIRDTNGDGCLEPDFSGAASGVYDLSIVAIVDRGKTPTFRATDVDELWPSSGLMRQAYWGDGQRYLRCDHDGPDAPCTLRVSIGQKGNVAPAAGLETTAK